jgi:opacity protein-like surface antigen
MKKIVRTAAIAATVAFGLVGNAQAQDIQPYAGVGVGTFNLDAGFGSAYAFGGFGLVGVDINEYAGVELRAGTTAKASVNVVSIPTENSIDYFFSYLAKLKLPVNENLGFYGLLGGTTLKTKFSVPAVGASTNTSTDFSYGAGIDYKIDDQMKVGAEWVQYSKKANSASPTFPGLDAYGISATLNIAF